MPLFNPYGMRIEPMKMYQIRGDTIQTFLWLMSQIFDAANDNNCSLLGLLEKATKERIEEIVSQT